MTSEQRRVRAATLRPALAEALRRAAHQIRHNADEWTSCVYGEESRRAHVELHAALAKLSHRMDKEAAKLEE